MARQKNRIRSKQRLGQKSRLRDDDLTLDESADIELKKMAHHVRVNDESTEPKAQTLTSLSVSDQSEDTTNEFEPKESDSAISKALNEAEMEDTLSQQENEKNEKAKKESL